MQNFRKTRMLCSCFRENPCKFGKKKSLKNINIPTIGIGAGSGCDGQVLVYHDMVGMNKGFSPKFLRRYLDLYTEITGRFLNM